MRRCLIHALFALAVTTPVTALAQENCPPGSWFCEQAEVPALPQATPPGAGAPAEAAPPPSYPAKPTSQPTSNQPPIVVYQPSPSSAPPQVVIVAPAGQPPPRVIVRTAPMVPPAPPPPPPPPKFRWRPEWGVNLRLEGVALGRHHGASDDAGMGGLGISLRYRPVPSFALDVGVDVLGGTDYNGFDRTEVPLSLNGILFVNPRSRVQFYFMGGLHISHAEVQVPIAEEEDWSTLDETDIQYDYFGGQGGIGLEFRISRRIALNIDALGFIRTRTDDGRVPEFIDPDTGRTTNTSGGGLFRGGISFYW